MSVMKTIPLTKGAVAKCDSKYFLSLVALGPWRLHSQGYACHSLVNRPTRWMHKEVYRLAGKRAPQVDHRNSDRLDNRRRNLRRASNYQNQYNRGPPSNNTSGFKGVSWNKARSRWRVSISANGVRIGLGLFRSKVDAALAYNRAAKRLHGSFARLNKV